MFSKTAHSFSFQFNHSFPIECVYQDRGQKSGHLVWGGDGVDGGGEGVLLPGKGPEGAFRNAVNVQSSSSCTLQIMQFTLYK